MVSLTLANMSQKCISSLFSKFLIVLHGCKNVHILHQRNVFFDMNNGPNFSIHLPRHVNWKLWVRCPDRIYIYNSIWITDPCSPSTYLYRQNHIKIYIYNMFWITGTSLLYVFWYVDWEVWVRFTDQIYIYNLIWTTDPKFLLEKAAYV